MFLPRVLRPLPRRSLPASDGLTGLAEAPFSVVRGPHGSYVAEALAGAIEGRDRWQHCVWLRTRGNRSALLAGRLASACAHRWGDPAPAGGLVETFSAAPEGAVIVLELDGMVSPGVGRLLGDLRRLASDRGISLVAVTGSRSSALVLRGADCVIAAGDLADPATVMATAAGLPARSLERLLELAAGRAAIISDVLDAAQAWPHQPIVDALDTSRRRQSLVDRLTANLLAVCTAGQREALEVGVATGYWHPSLATDAVQVSALRPWMVPLEQQWGWLRPVWARSLHRHLFRRSDQVRQRLPVQASAVEQPAPEHGVVEARLLGPFELRIDGVTVGRWPGQRGMSVLRYLLSRRNHGCSRDELLEEFWPQVAPLMARNRLQVAISGLRGVLREVTALQVIEYADGGYRINPQIRLKVDVERFEETLSAARAAERAGDSERALGVYGDAISLYRGDFAVDVPYEGWTLLPRESLRIRYVDALDRMSRLQADHGRLDDCIATAHRMLDIDPCREDAHRTLMRCYANQGRSHQAVRQYEFCRRILRGMLETAPSPQTVQLYRAIREGSLPEPSLIG